jgi:prevent-host-death family protein
MTVTAKDLRLKTSEILKKVQRVGSITITLRGKPVARLTSTRREKSERDLKDYRAIGMWAGRKDMKNPAAWVRKVRQPRYSLR